MPDSIPIENKVTKSGLITLDLKKYMDPAPVAEFDMKDYLYMELILREKDFREALDAHKWEQYRGKNLAVFCSADAIIASWAYMLVARYAAGTARSTWFGSKPDVYLEAYRGGLDREDWAAFAGKRVLLKGCSDAVMPASVYLYATNKLLPHAERIMYGEACSFVPVFRAEKNKPVAAGE